MKKAPFALLPLLAVSMLACAQGRKTSKTSTSQTSSTAATKAPEITSVTLHRGACFGRCPVYSLKVESDGTLTYTGERNTDMEGVFTKKATPDAARKLLQEFRKHRVDTCTSEYTVMIADVPRISYIVEAGGNTVYVNNANFGPDFLGVLAVKVDDLGQTTPGEWKKIGGLPR